MEILRLGVWSKSKNISCLLILEWECRIVISTSFMVNSNTRGKC